MIFFVTPQFVKTYTPVAENVDEKKIAPLAQFASKAWILPMIGTFFYNDLLTKYNEQSLNPDEQILVNKIQFCISNRIAADLCISTTYILSNKGLQTQNGDNSESVDKDEVQYVRTHYLGQANYFEEEIKKYLLTNSNLFPNFIDPLNYDSNIKCLCQWLSFGMLNCQCGYCGRGGQTRNFLDSNGFIFL